MAQYLLIRTTVANVCEENDIIAIRGDKHIFDPNEHKKFKVVKTEKTEEEVLSELISKLPSDWYLREKTPKFITKFENGEIVSKI